jgi:hypothetical protein
MSPSRFTKLHAYEIKGQKQQFTAMKSLNQIEFVVGHCRNHKRRGRERYKYIFV